MATIRDVATKAGVAPSTVSLVLNAKPWVSSDIRQAVQQAVQQLRYVPRKTGRPRRGDNAQATVRRKNQIAFLFNGDPAILHSSLYTGILRGIQSACDKAGKAVVINTCGAESRGLNFLVSKVDGAIFTGEIPTPQLLDLINHVPAVRAMGVPLEGERWDHVTYDNQSVGRMVAKYLLDRGHKRFGYFAPYVGGPDDGPIDPSLPGSGLRYVAEDREVQFARMVREAGCSFVRNAGHTTWLPNSQAELINSVRRLMSDPHRPSAIFAPTDWIACLLYPALQSLGIQPGVDVEIASCDNDIWKLQGLLPRPVTVDLSTFSIGQRSVQVLLERIADPTAPRSLTRYDSQLVPPTDR